MPKMGHSELIIFLKVSFRQKTFRIKTKRNQK
nr:MAG TPA: hypothetical protein [Siphoviridae sp. ctFjF5]DAU57460.1 MAG TPA: hypothetical protein [Caudoviricetes sp.]